MTMDLQERIAFVGRRSADAWGLFHARWPLTVAVGSEIIGYRLRKLLVAPEAFNA